MSGIQLVASHEGAAVRYQLDAMIKVLTPWLETDDPLAQELVARLGQAHAVAEQIEQRGSTEPAYKGVLLARR